METGTPIIFGNSTLNPEKLDILLDQKFNLTKNQWVYFLKKLLVLLWMKPLTFPLSFLNFYLRFTYGIFFEILCKIMIWLEGVCKNLWFMKLNHFTCFWLEYNNFDFFLSRIGCRISDFLYRISCYGLVVTLHTKFDVNLKIIKNNFEE